MSDSTVPDFVVVRLFSTEIDAESWRKLRSVLTKSRTGSFGTTLPVFIPP